MNRQLPKSKYLAVRLFLWTVAVVIAAIPALYEFKDWNQITDGEAFSDVLFIVVPVSALALSTTFDYLCVGFPDLSANEFFNGIFSIFLNSIGLIAALTGFVSLDKGPMSGRAITIYTAVIGISVVSSFVTECVVTWNHHGFRPTVPAPGAVPAPVPTPAPQAGTP